MSKHNIDNQADNTEDAREGGREDAKRPTPGIFRRGASPPQGRNSSGVASTAANLLDLRMKVNFMMDILSALCHQLGDPELAQEVDSMKQRGFRRGR